MELKQILSWLSGFPGFAGYQWELDCQPHKPNLATLTSQGVRLSDSIEDLLGNRKDTMKLTCTLAFSGNDKAQTLVDLQHWVARENALGLCPQLGQGRKLALLSDGKRLMENKLGLFLYTAQLTLTYELFYEVNENGEN